MIVTFDREYLRDLYQFGKTSDEKYRFQPEIIQKYKRCIDMLLSANGVEVLYTIKSLNYEMLKGNKKGISSIRINKQYRIEFTVIGNHAEPIVTVCNILELSNHYK